MIRSEDFAFTVHVSGEDWHAYYFEKDGKKGTMAFAQRGEKFVIGVFCAGTLTRQETMAKLSESDKGETT